jgi:hypothetical protein
MPPDKLIASIVGVFAAFTAIFGIIKYFINLGNKIDTLVQDNKDFKLQQKKQWEKIDRTRDEVRAEREKRIGLEKELQHQKEITKELKNTNRFRLEALGAGGEE